MRFPRVAAYYAVLIGLGASSSLAMKLVENVQQSALAARGWLVKSEPAAEQTLTLQIGLTLQNTDRLIDELYKRSDPDSKYYGLWLDRDEVNAIVQPTSMASQTVAEWLQDQGVQIIKNDGTWITFQIPVSQANQLMNANFMEYEKDGISKIRTVSYSVPDEVAEHIDIIHPTTFFGETKAFAPVHYELPTSTKHQEEKRQAMSTTVSPSCATSITPSCLRQLYNFVNYKPDPLSGSRVGFGSFLNQSARYEDLFLYQNEFGIARQNFTKVFVNNATDDQDPRTGEYGEANLDVQNINGVAPGLPVTEFLTGGKPPFIPDPDLPDENSNTNEPYVPYYQFLLSKTNAELPQSISNSYGEPEQTVPRKYAERTCTMIAMMGLRGISVFESSGDTGIGSGCRANDGSNKIRLNAQFPSTCPYITSIGGTEAAIPEVAWRDSSGGFSYYWARPAYQNTAIEKWLRSGIPGNQLAYLAPYFNQNGRAFPDFSAHSLLPNFVIFGGGKKYPRGNGGTSASAPVIAGIVALLNDARLRAGKPTMGFLNPWLYKRYGVMLRDVALGRTRGCDGKNYQTGANLTNAGVIPGAGWDAVKGWDPATGLGTPDFELMRRVALMDAGVPYQ